MRLDAREADRIADDLTEQAISRFEQTRAQIMSEEQWEQIDEALGEEMRALISGFDWPDLPEKS